MKRVPVCENKEDYDKLVTLHMSKVNVVNDQPENFIVMPEELIILYGGGQLFKILIRPRSSRYPHARSGTKAFNLRKVFNQAGFPIAC